LSLILVKSRINEDYDANMICINKIKMKQKQYQDLEKAESKEQEKKKNELSSLLNDDKMFSNNIDKSEVALIKLDDVSLNKLSSKIK
jgi:hypothetical protein